MSEGWPRADTCDLVMKGGVTSGVAYPAAVMTLKDRYRFVNIGGASAGAIAAAATAAAEFARPEDGFTRLDEVRAELRQPDLLPRLFQPTKEARPAIDLLLALQGRQGALGKAWVGLWRLWRRVWLPVAIQVSAVFCVGAIAIGQGGGTWRSLGAAGWLAFAALLLLATVVAFVVIVVGRAVRLAVSHLPSSFFGMCLGKAEGRTTHPALTEWLHSRIQGIAFGADAARRPPLTFADLKTRDVHLRMMTTDLTRARPARMPYQGDEYLFAPSEFAVLFPDDVVASMRDPGPKVRPAGDGAPELHPFPSDALPVVVATRMSMSLPGLLAAVPLWTVQDGDPVRHWLSDGGMASNFPIHFFDTWVPGRPTFGLTLVPAPRVEHRPGSVGAAVERHVRSAAPMRRARIRSSAGFVAQIMDTMQNWRDTMQSELPQFRDRIAEIKLDPGEGGMNIAMPAQVIARIDAKGSEAAEHLAGFDWPSHQLHRYASFMRLLQRNIQPATGGAPPGLSDVLSEEFRAWLRDGCPGVERPLDRPERWFTLAADATERMLRDACAWLDAAEKLSFVDGPDEHPASVMRISPDV